MALTKAEKEKLKKEIIDNFSEEEYMDKMQNYSYICSLPSTFYDNRFYEYLGSNLNKSDIIINKQCDYMRDKEFRSIKIELFLTMFLKFYMTEIKNRYENFLINGNTTDMLKDPNIFINLDKLSAPPILIVKESKEHYIDRIFENKVRSINRKHNKVKISEEEKEDLKELDRLSKKYGKKLV